MGYKHMSHIYENPDLTFAEIKNIFTKASEGELEGTEKTDGQNMLVSYSVVDGEARAARSNSMLKGTYLVKGKGRVRKHSPGGVNAIGWAEKWADHPSKSVRAAFVEAFEIFERACNSLTPEEQESVFGDGVNYMVFYNCEVQDPRNMNTIRYDKKTLTIHRVGHLYIDLSDGGVRDISVDRNAVELQRTLRTMQKSIENSEFALEINAIRQLKGLADKAPLKNAIKQLEAVIDKVGLSDNQTVGEYTLKRLISSIRSYVELPVEKEKLLIRKILGYKGLNINLVKKDLSPDQKNLVNKLYSERRMLLTTAIRPIENVIHDFAVEMLKGVESRFVLDQDSEIKRLRREISNKRKEIENSGDKEKIDLMLRHFEKIKDIENISTAAEGFVFDYDGQTYKFTGNFAPINQILGIGKYGGRGSVDEDLLAEQDSEERIIALIPGKFKPPHRGHLNMVKHYSELADEVKVLISPLSRKAGDVDIDAEDAIAVWKIYLQNAGLTNVTVMRSPKESPVGAAFDFVSNDVNNPDYSQPGDSIILGASTKGGDQSRFAGNVQKYAQEGVTVLNPMEYVFTPPEDIPYNASDFRNAIAQREDISRFLPEESMNSQEEIMAILGDSEKKSLTMEYLFSLVEEILEEKKKKKKKDKEEIDETSAMGAGAVQGASGNNEDESLIREEDQ